MNNINIQSKPIISEELADQLRNAYSVIYAAMAAYGEMISAPYEKADRKQVERTLTRGMAALDARVAWLREQEVAAFRAGVRAAISPALDRARGEKQEYDLARETMSPALAKLLAPFPTFINVPLDDVADVFGGADTQVQVRRLTDMGYKVAKAATGAYSIRVDLPKSILGESSLL